MVTIDLSEEVVLITGAAGGIGAACVARLAESGARVAATDVDGEGLSRVATSVKGITPYQCDLSDPESVDQMMTRIESELGAVSRLVNCAGLIAYRRGLAAIDDADWGRVLDVNLTGAFYLCRRAIAPMKELGRGGIVLFSSLAAEVGGIEVGAHYAATKAGLIGLARTLAKEAGPSGVTVNTVAPGIIGTAPVLKQIEGHADSYSESIPLGRIGTPTEVADVVLFLCSPLSAYITGATLDINGGLYMG